MIYSIEKIASILDGKIVGDGNVCINMLSKIDTSDVKPMTHVNNLTNVYREDQSKESLTTKEAIENSPETFGQFFKIPKIID